MSATLQNVMASSTQKAADELIKAFLNLPEDKRDWSPDSKARTALDQIAECALLNGYTAELVQSKVWSTTNFANFSADKERIAQSWESVKDVLEENTIKLAGTIKALSDPDIKAVIELPWGPQTMAEIIMYPYWNMSYHLGQINYIASMLGVLN